MSIGTKMRARLRLTPRRFQIRGVRFLEERKGRAILGDDCGLGKTMQAMSFLLLHPETRPAIIVCPATLKLMWKEMLWEQCRLRSTVLNGTKAHAVFPKGISIINYDITAHWLKHLKLIKPQAIVFDEFHHIKNMKARRTKACMTLARGSRNILGLSATPMLNRPVELFPILNLIAPETFPSFWKFAFRYCGPKRGYMGRGWDFRGSSHLDELHKLIAPLMLRRMKHQVAKELPPKIRTIIPVNIDNKRAYAFARDRFLQWIDELPGEKGRRSKGAVALVRLTRLRRLVAQGKVSTAIRWIREWLDRTNKKLVVFVIHRFILNQLHEAFPNSLVLTGKTPMKKRKPLEKKFQTDPKCRLLLGTMKVAGQGLTLTAASTALFIELWWTPGDHDQAEDRILRIGQTSEKVNCFYLVGWRTIDVSIMQRADQKREIISQTIEGKPAGDLLTDDFNKVLDDIILKLRKERESWPERRRKIPPVR